MKSFVALMIGVAGSAGCGQDDPGTSVRVTLVYDDGLGLETADLTLDDRTVSGAIAHELLVLVPDELAGVVMPMEVWARRDGERAAFGTATAVPELDATVSASVTLNACTPACNGDMLTTCTGPVVECGLGCSEVGDAHCVVPKPSNGIDPTGADSLRKTITISEDTTFDVDTGTITGGLVRAGVTGFEAGVGYIQSDGIGGGARLGIFVFRNLVIESLARVQFTGTRAVVLLVGEAATIDGDLDLTGGRTTRTTPGPGGGAGGTLTIAAGGCGPGGPGRRGTAASTVEDSGGAGGGAKSTGGVGGSASTNTSGGAAGLTCLELDLEPLQGGSGGGAGSTGGQLVAAAGGGGGGALQITALVSLEINGTIHAGGEGGEGGSTGPDPGSGAGGGAGGVILIESPIVVIGLNAVLAANGGGGGAGGNGSSVGPPGQGALLSRTTASGGFSSVTGVGSGGSGAGGSFSAGGGLFGSNAAGGGGGGVGSIVIRGRQLSLSGTFSPDPIQADVQQL